MSNNRTSIKLQKVPNAEWSIYDILGVLSLVSVIAIVVYIASDILIGDEKIMLRLFRYVVSLTGIFLPVLWIKKRYGLSKEVLGLRKGHLDLSFLVFIGAITALFYTLLKRFSPFWRNSILNDVNISDHHVYWILVPISIGGFAMFVLGPFCEEVLWRGFIYGYLRKKFGVVSGLILQSLLFSLSHFGFIYGDAFYLISSRFLTGIIIGILYEKTGSLYPSIVFHGVFNYLLVIFSLSWK